MVCFVLETALAAGMVLHRADGLSWAAPVKQAWLHFQSRRDAR
jgi:hypothetical protein